MSGIAVSGKGEKRTELGLNRGSGLIINSPFEICVWNMINLEVCIRVSPAVANT